jgi:uncharacterized protein YjiS (DUF1127 family)
MNGLSDVRLALYSQELEQGQQGRVSALSASKPMTHKNSLAHYSLWALYCHRWMSRKTLLNLTADELRDVGLNPTEAYREGIKPFWRG